MAEVDRIYRRTEMRTVTGYCVPYIYELIAAGKFPKPIKLGDRAVGWLASEIAEWQRRRIAERDAQS